MELIHVNNLNHGNEIFVSLSVLATIIFILIMCGWRKNDSSRASSVSSLAAPVPRPSATVPPPPVPAVPKTVTQLSPNVTSPSKTLNTPATPGPSSATHKSPNVTTPSTGPTPTNVSKLTTTNVKQSSGVPQTSTLPDPTTSNPSGGRDCYRQNVNSRPGTQAPRPMRKCGSSSSLTSARSLEDIRLNAHEDDSDDDPIPQSPSSLKCSTHGKYCRRCKNIWSRYSMCGAIKIEIAPSTTGLLEIFQTLVDQTWKYDTHMGQDARGLAGKKMKIQKVYKIWNNELWSRFKNTKYAFHLRALEEKGECFLPIDKATGSKGEKILTQDFHPHQISEMKYDWRVNEAYLFHGTKSEHVDGIIKDGFKLSKADRTLYGGAVYLAESAQKSDQYTDYAHSRSAKNLHMFVVRAVLGRSYIHTAETQVTDLPCKKKGCMRQGCTDHESFDTVVAGVQKRFREFLVYDKDVCYPQFLLVYDRV